MDILYISFVFMIALIITFCLQQKDAHLKLMSRVGKNDVKQLQICNGGACTTMKAIVSYIHFVEAVYVF